MSEPDGTNDWKLLRRLMRDAAIGAASKLCFKWLWDHAGRRPGQLSVSKAALAYELGRSPRAVEKWLAELVKAGLLEVADRDRRRGVVDVFVFQPNPGEAFPQRSDPQTKLPLEQPAPEAAPDARAGFPSAGDRSDVTAPQRPYPPADHFTPTPPPRQSDVTAPRKAPKGPRPIDTKEKETSNSPKYQRTTQFQTNGSRPQSDVTAPKGPGGEAAAMRTLQQVVGSARSAKKRGGGADPPQVGLVVAAALLEREQTEHPLQQKKRLAQRIREVVNDPNMLPYVSGAAADLVVFHEVPIGELDKILAQLDAKRRAGTLTTAGGFFHYKVRNLAAARGKPWPVKPKGRRQNHE